MDPVTQSLPLSPGMERSLREDVSVKVGRFAGPRESRVGPLDPPGCGPTSARVPTGPWPLSGGLFRVRLGPQ